MQLWVDFGMGKTLPLLPCKFNFLHELGEDNYRRLPFSMHVLGLMQDPNSVVKQRSQFESHGKLTQL